MNTSQPIRFRGAIKGGHKPGLLTWMVLAAILVVTSLLPVVGLIALGVFVAFFLPAAIGSFIGWLLAGVRDEVRMAFQAFRRKV